MSRLDGGIRFPGPQAGAPDPDAPLKRFLLGMMADQPQAAVKLAALYGSPAGLQRLRAEYGDEIAAAEAEADQPTTDHAESGDVALAGPDGARAKELLAASVRRGSGVLARLARAAAERLLADPQRAANRAQLFGESELADLEASLAAVNATADLLGRARVRERMARATEANGLHRFAEDRPLSAFAESLEPLPPERALAYFRSLVPELGVDPKRFADAMKRRAFTLAVNTEQQVLKRVQDAIAERLEQGTPVTQAAADVAAILDAAGVGQNNSSYAEMVFRTNGMDSFNTGATDELQSPDVKDFFPVWRYVGVRDGRQGADHEPHFDRYYPNSRTFAEVRGDRPYNCRCSMVPVDRFEWEELRKSGARMEG